MNIMFDKHGKILQSTGHGDDVTSTIKSIGAHGCVVVKDHTDWKDRYVCFDGDWVLKDRPTMSLSIDRSTIGIGETATLSGLPDGATISINGRSPVAVSGGSVALTGEHPMVYEIHVEAWPRLPADLEVTCEASA